MLRLSPGEPGPADVFQYGLFSYLRPVPGDDGLLAPHRVDR